MKRRVVFSDSDSDGESNAVKKSDSKPSKKSKLKQDAKNKLKPIFDDEINVKGKCQLSIEDSFKKQSQSQKSCGRSKPKTLDSYFSPSPKVTSKKRILVDDFFGQSSPILKNSPKNSINTSSLNSSTDIIPDTPVSKQDSGLCDRLVNDSFGQSPKPRSMQKRKDAKESPTVAAEKSPTVGASKVAKSTPVKSTPDRKPFWAYHARDGPRHLGEKLIPKGSPNCLATLNFVITGVLEYIERDDMANAIHNCGGKVLKTLGKKTDYLVIGREPGQSKLAKADAMKIKQLTEDELFEMIEKSSPNKDLKIVKPVPNSSQSVVENKGKKSQKTTSPPLTARPVLSVTQVNSMKDKSNNNSITSIIKSEKTCTVGSTRPINTELWVDKYKPNALRNLVGQNGQHSPANRLHAWISTWQANYSTGLKTKAYSNAPSWGAGSSDDGKWARAVLLSGPPGIGKTTTAFLVCGDLGFTTCEFNASDCRSKRTLSDEVQQSLGMRNLSSIATGQASEFGSNSHALIMDEVDGVAGSEDRGGMQELVNMIKTTRIPIICICNDRQSPKIRSLANYCLDLRFHRPRVEQIKSYVMSILCKEGVELAANILTDIIHASNQDIRQVVNNVQLWCSSNSPSPDQLNVNVNTAPKDLHMSAFDLIRKVFAPDISGSKDDVTTFNKSLDLFFQDYSLMPLFVQENYLNVNLRVNHTSDALLKYYAEASLDIATGDIVSNIIRSKAGTWSLLPLQGVFSVVRPGYILRGSLPGGPVGVKFPSWFGKNSTQGRLSRVSAELASHLRLATHCGSANSLSLLLDYVTPLADSIVRSLKEGDVDTAIQLLIKYRLTRDDLDSIMELSTWSSRPNRMSLVDTKVKSALTRNLNKSSHLLPYTNSLASAVRQKRAASANVIEEGGNLTDDNGVFANEDDDDYDDDGGDAQIDLKNDAMIVVKGESVATKKSKSSTTSSTSKSGRARGAGSGGRRAKH